MMQSSSCQMTPSSIFSALVLFSLFFSPTFSSINFREANETSMRQINALLKKINKPFLKSIKSPDGDIIDCVLFHLQPAFDNPKLKENMLLNPPELPKNDDDNAGNNSEIKQLWNSMGESCPNGTIPIRRTSASDILRYDSISRFGKKYTNYNPGVTHEHSIVYVRQGEFYGAKAILNVWKPYVDKYEFSVSQIWVVSEVPTHPVNTIEVGWNIYPLIYRDRFVQTNHKISLGASIDPVSTYNGPQYQITLLVWKDPKSKNWCLKVGDELLGYWPSSLFPDLGEHATAIHYGGEVLTDSLVKHPPTQMGSGHFQGEGYKKAAYIKHLQTVDQTNTLVDVSNLNLLAEKPNCYVLFRKKNKNLICLCRMMQSSSCIDIPLIISVVVLLFSPSFCSKGFQEENETMNMINARLEKINKPFVKSIESPDGDIIDCVLFHLQPAFDIPELREKMSLTLPELPKGHDNAENNQEIKQLWNSKGETCPNGTIPIRRTSASDILRSDSISKSRKKYSRKDIPDAPNHEHAIGYVNDGNFYGAKAFLSVYKPNVIGNDFSLSQIWVIGDVANRGANTIEAGWQIYPHRGDNLPGDSLPRLFTYWTDVKSGDWWLRVGSELIGYWPANLFSGLRDHANTIQYGGEVYSAKSSKHTSTQMGSGHFPEEGLGKAAFVRNVEVIDEMNNLNTIQNVELFAENPNCYDVKSGYNAVWGSYIYYGGPGYSPKCL
ncbi:hypothetical protein L1987_62082 [Smallanthus sonchifolius]|uniref:Uncharacterized protein n=1 Tax=Smallanthus sonchifolius TaxID=185202 RepID=A0ACB9C9Q2_9ASTR|nr:hypothetical protein L1987_62082 [Smallanthus sonchifolius]